MSTKHAPLSGLLLTGLVPAALGLAPADGHANDQDLREQNVPAVSCFVSENAPEEEHPYKGGGHYSRFTTGSTVIECPLSANSLDTSRGRGGNHISKFRVHYRDLDGLETDSEVEVQLVRSYITDRTAVYEQVCIWNSNLDGPDITNYTTTTVPCVHSFGQNAFYWFVVILSVGNDGQADFLGIDFPR